ncbi:MAG TPA: polyphosphate kinase 1 [Verrucomicrobiota bacterium]|nr:polyphosphate kinase 1 [Verrucomicrobiota bacterium]HRT09271.1 polyphosphate kinase 1 [Candidatus Paceibacterota bacterium]HRT56473.1 polyphosphate kinase 1 [Candidatus Paceibacterota bacterium]
MAKPAAPIKTFGPAQFLNRELSWLEFNQRVLDEALDGSNPLLERLKFFCIVSSNLDEFFEVRVAGIKQQIESEVVERSLDGRTASETFRAITQRVREMVADAYACWREQLHPSLGRNGIRVLFMEELDTADLAWLQEYYRTQVRPVLTPLAIDPAHPFPQLLNKSLNLIVRLELDKEQETHKHLAVVQIPRILPRLIRLPRSDGRRDYVYLSRLIGHFLGDLFPGARLLGWWPFRVTRNSELYIDEEETANLLKAVENELHNRRKGDAVRLEVEDRCPSVIRQALLSTLHLTEEDEYLIDGPLNPTRLMILYEGDHSPELRDPPFVAPVAAPLRDQPDLFAAIRERDILLHHPYENFSSVVDFLEQAAADPDVLAIKQTLYRTGGDPRIVGALEAAVRHGKQVTAVVELRARFDEANNIQWARQLEESGVHVVYGLVGYKIHAKACLVVRREGHQIRRYVHLATGNYNPNTARLYTDLSFFTCRPDFGEDATNFFNLLTGICQFQGMKKWIVAPFDFHSWLLGRIERERENARQGLPAKIMAKINSLAEREIIEALYRASQAGVIIDLTVRGICCLRPGVKGLSETITVRSIVDRFLEHSRIYYFENACQPEVFLASADWLPRNCFRRIELAFPIEDGVLRERLISEILATTMADNTKARLLQPDGSYRRAHRAPEEPVRRSQFDFIALATGATPARQAKTAKTRYPKVKLAPSPFGPPSRAQ